MTIHAERQAFLSELAANLDQNISTDSRYQDELVILRKHMKVKEQLMIMTKYDVSREKHVRLPSAAYTIH